MAVTLVTNGNFFMGLAVDSKPTGQPAGTRFFTSDIGVWSVYDGQTWSTLTAPGLTAPGAASLTSPAGSPTVVGLVEVVARLDKLSDQLQEMLVLAEAFLDQI